MAVLTVRENEEISDLRRSVTGGDASAEQPLAVDLVEQCQFGGGVLKLPVSGRWGRDRRRRNIDSIVFVDGIDPLQMGRFPSNACNSNQVRIQLELFPRTNPIIRCIAERIALEKA